MLQKQNSNQLTVTVMNYFISHQGSFNFCIQHNKIATIMFTMVPSSVPVTMSCRNLNTQVCVISFKVYVSMFFVAMKCVINCSSNWLFRRVRDNCKCSIIIITRKQTLITSSADYIVVIADLIYTCTYKSDILISPSMALTFI